jgi:three-Cys-motif partner protein
MAVPNAVVWPCKPHTLAKHRILQRYLEAWYPIFMQETWCSSVTYAEGFAGSGIYTNGKPGSPVIAADVFLARRNYLDIKAVNMVLVEADCRRLVRLKQEMTVAVNRGGTPPAGLRVSYQEGECSSKLLPALAKAGALESPIFAFLDSFGGPDVPLRLVRTIARQSSGEVLVTFGTNFLTRFGTKDQYQESGDEVFGSSAWRRVHQIPSQEKKAFLVSTFRESLSMAGFTYVVSFEMIDDTGSDLHLVFGTRNRRGLEKMKDAMWQVDPVNGVHYRDPRDPNQMMLDFDLSPHLEPLSHALLHMLAFKEHTLADLQEHALLETVYRSPHATAAVRTMLAQGLIERHPPTTGQLTRTTRVRLAAAGRQRLTDSAPTLF